MSESRQPELYESGAIRIKGPSPHRRIPARKLCRRTVLANLPNWIKPRREPTEFRIDGDARGIPDHALHVGPRVSLMRNHWRAAIISLLALSWQRLHSPTLMLTRRPARLIHEIEAPGPLSRRLNPRPPRRLHPLPLRLAPPGPRADPRRHPNIDAPRNEARQSAAAAWRLPAVTPSDDACTERRVPGRVGVTAGTLLTSIASVVLVLVSSG